jgi:hypothetical protein
MAGLLIDSVVAGLVRCSNCHCLGDSSSFLHSLFGSAWCGFARGSGAGASSFVLISPYRCLIQSSWSGPVPLTPPDRKVLVFPVSFCCRIDLFYVRSWIPFASCSSLLHSSQRPSFCSTSRQQPSSSLCYESERR